LLAGWTGVSASPLPNGDKLGNWKVGVILMPIKSRFSSGSLVVFVAAALALAPSFARAQSASPPSRSSAPAAPAVEGEFRLTGFRSALFGMTPDQVRQAIRRDFAITPDKIETAENGAERTTILAITVPDLLPSSGPAQIAYVIGFRSRQLVQVTVTFGGAANPQLAPPVAVDLARMLQTHLVGVGYKPDTVAVNLAQPDGTILVFRGDDTQGRRTIAALNGVAAAEGQRPAAVPTLQVSYIRDPQNPDVFQIRKGDF
jgi:hypothetical protein